MYRSQIMVYPAISGMISLTKVFMKLSSWVSRHQRDATPLFQGMLVSTNPRLLVEWTLAYPLRRKRASRGSDEIGLHLDHILNTWMSVDRNLASSVSIWVVLPLPSIPDIAMRNPRKMNEHPTRLHRPFLMTAGEIRALNSVSISLFDVFVLLRGVWL